MKKTLITLMFLGLTIPALAQVGVIARYTTLTPLERAQQELDEKLIGAGASYVSSRSDKQIDIALVGGDADFAASLCSFDDGMIVQLDEITYGDFDATGNRSVHACE